MALQYIFFSQNLHNNKCSFPAERRFIVPAIQHGHNDFICRSAVPLQKFSDLSQTYFNRFFCRVAVVELSKVGKASDKREQFPEKLPFCM